MNKASVYSSNGVRKSTKATLPKIFDEKPNMTLLAQAIRVYEDRLHIGSSKTKTRSEVSASTAKIWRQKGTGRARHGARSAPIFVGGGKAHGPTGVTKVLSLPTKMRRKALRVALSIKASQDKVAVVESISKIKKTKAAQKLIDKVLGKKPQKVTVVLSGGNREAGKVFRNIERVFVVSFKNLNTYDVFYGGLLVFDKEIFSKKPATKGVAAKREANKK